MKILSFCLAMLISFNLFAADNGGKLLSQLVDNYNYALTVEWDQKDKVAFEKINNDFRSETLKVLQQEEISKEDLEKFLESKVSNKKTLNDLKVRLSQMSATPTSSEIFSFFEETKSSLYNQGASWNGDVLATGGLVLLGIGMIALIVSAFINGSKTCEDDGQQTVTTQYNCGIRSVCVSHGESYCLSYQDQYKCDEKTQCI